MEDFIAGVQYDDLTGSVAADDAHDDELGVYLQARNLISSESVVVGFSAYYADITEQVSVDVFYTIDVLGDKQPIKVHKVNIDMTPNEFFERFKRINIIASYSGVLNGKKLEIIE